MRSRFRPAALLTAAVVALPIAASAQESVGSKNLPVLPDTYGTVVIGNVVGLLSQAGELASTVMPGMNKDMLRQQAGAMLGDPNLEGLPEGAGIAVVIPRSGLPIAYVEVAPSKLAHYKETVSKFGQQAAESDGLLLVAGDPGSLDAGKRFASGVKGNVLAGSGASSIAGTMKLAEILKQYEPQIKGALEQSLSKADQQTTALPQKEQLQAVLKMYYALGKRIETLEMAFAPSVQGLGMDYVVTPVGGGTPTDALKTVPEPAQGPAMLKLLPAASGMRGEYTFDPKWMAGPMMNTFAEIMREGGVAQERTDKMKKWMESWVGAMSGGMAISFGGDAENPMASTYAFSITDEEAAIKLLREMPEKMESTGLADFYKALNMPMSVSWKDNTGEHAGVKIHQLTMKMDFSSQPEAIRENMEKRMGTVVYNVATTNKVLLYAIEPEKLEPLIDAARAGSNPAAKPLVSETNLPKGGTYYFDYNVGTMMDFAMASQPASQEKMKSVADAAKNAPPVQIGGYSESGSMRAKVLVPAEMIRAMVGSAMAQPQATTDSKPTGTTNE